MIKKQRKFSIRFSQKASARYFGVSDRYFLDIQNDLDIRALKMNMADEIAAIKPYAAAI